MGAAAGLFFSANDSDKQTLHKRITPSSKQFDEQQERWNLLADHLVSDLRQRSGYLMRTWLQGSYKFGTQVRPPRGEEFDIDLGIYFLWSGADEDGIYDADELRGLVQTSLLSFADDNYDDVLEVTAPKTRCLRVRYTDGFHIDVPAYHLDERRDARALATAGGWEDSDPKSIYLWFKSLFDDWKRQKLRRCIRYVKAWAALKFDVVKRLSSIALTVAIAQAAQELEGDEWGADDDVLTSILEIVHNRLLENTEIPNPVDDMENLSRLSAEDMSNFMEGWGGFLDAARRATDDITELQAADIWQEPFEHLFPMPEVDLDVAAKANNLPASRLTPEIVVRATSGITVLTGNNSIGPVPKGSEIQFTVTNALDLPRSACVTWVVRNEGSEAEQVNDLGHLAGEGLTVSRAAAYRGTHYMDCMVKLGATTIAMRRVPVTISGHDVPRRNPRLRPEWVKLRGRR